MKPFRNKLLLRWREPRFLAKHLKKQLTLSARLNIHLRVCLHLTIKCLLFVVVVWAVVHLIRQDGGLISWWPVVSGIFMGVIVHLMSWLSSLFPAEIKVREKNIVIVGASGASIIPYKEVQSCTVREVELGEQRYEVLEVKSWDGNEYTLEIAPNISGQVVIEQLQKQGLQVRRA